MSVTQLEADLLTEMARRGATVAQLLTATRLHADVAPSTPAALVLQALLDGWITRGWLVIGELGPDGCVTDWQPLAPGALTVGTDADPRLWLTAQARAEHPGLAGPSNVALQQTSGPGMASALPRHD
jgi:hypothetical protein